MAGNLSRAASATIRARLTSAPVLDATISPPSLERAKAVISRSIWAAFCASIGLTGYPQLRIRLAEEAARRVEPFDARVAGGAIHPGADLSQIIATVAFNDARAVGMGNDARKFERPIGGAFLIVGGVDAGGVQPDEHLTRPSARYFHIADFDYLLGETTFFVPTCQHVIPG